MATLPPSQFKAKDVASRLRGIIRQNYAAPHVFLLRELTNAFRGFLVEESLLARFRDRELITKVLHRWDAVVRHLKEDDVVFNTLVVPTIFTIDSDNNGIVGSYTTNLQGYGIYLIAGTLYRERQQLTDTSSGKLTLTLPGYLDCIRKLRTNDDYLLTNPWLRQSIIAYGHYGQFDKVTLDAIREINIPSSVHDNVYDPIRQITNAFF